MESRKNSHSLPAYHSGTQQQHTAVNWPNGFNSPADYHQYGNAGEAFNVSQVDGQWATVPDTSDWNQILFPDTMSLDPGNPQTMSPADDLLQDIFPDQEAVKALPVNTFITSFNDPPRGYGGPANIAIDYRLNNYAAHRSSRSEPGVTLPQIVEYSEEESSEQDSAYQTQPTELASNVDYPSQPAGRTRQDAGTLQRRESAGSAQQRRRLQLVSSGSDGVVPTSTGRGKRGSGPEQDICPTCSYQPKNASEASKHYNKHAKPFKCPYSPCKEKYTGFATSNDLDRHLKSGKHNLRPQKGSGKGYICSACKVAPDAEAKWWPRLDNFKAHIRRRHKEHQTDTQIDHLARMSERDATQRPGNAVTEYGENSTYYPGTSLIDRYDNYQHMDTAGATDSAMTRSLSVQGETSLWLGGEATLASTSDQLAGVGKALHVANSSASRPFDVARTHRSSTATELRISSADATMIGLDLANSRVPRILVHGPQSIPAKRLADETWELGTAKRLPDLQADHISETVDDCEGEGPFTCRICSKQKARKCDLKKHQKRHTRPYGCTSPRCYARQGSRSDWKRHEEKQHCVRESWKCRLPLMTSKSCVANFYLLEQFEKHLTQTHKCSTQDVARYRQTMHLGRDAHRQFWCGFCNYVVLQDSATKLTAKQYRLAHIGDHFDKDSRVIDDWMCLEQGKPYRQIRREERKQARADYNKPGSDLGVGDLRIDQESEIVPPSAVVEGKITVDADLFSM